MSDEKAKYPPPCGAGTDLGLLVGLQSNGDEFGQARAIVIEYAEGTKSSSGHGTGFLHDVAEEYRQLKIPLYEQGRFKDPSKLRRILDRVIRHQTLVYAGWTRLDNEISVTDHLDRKHSDWARSVLLRWEDREMTLGVFLLDDHEVVRSGLRGLLEAGGDIKVVGEAGTVAEALARIPPTRPNVAVLDVRLPDGSGIEVCREIRSRWPEIACLMLTSYADDEALFAAIMAGAAGYLLKRVGSTDLVDAVRRAGEGQSLLDPSLTTRVLERLRTGPDEDQRLASLTPQERRILELITEGYTNRQIADAMILAEKTVKNYISNLLAKLGVERRTQAATFAARLDERSAQAARIDGTGT